MATDETLMFNMDKESNEESKEILKKVYDALEEKGYNPINQIVGYILSGDPTYITSHNDARNKIRAMPTTVNTLIPRRQYFSIR